MLSHNRGQEQKSYGRWKSIERSGRDDVIPYGIHMVI